MIDGVDVEAPLEGSMLVIHNDDQPGVIGEVGTILGQAPDQHRELRARPRRRRARSAWSTWMRRLATRRRRLRRSARLPAVRTAKIASVSDSDA